MRKPVKPMICRTDPPTSGADVEGAKVAGTEHLSVPELARHLVAELHDEFGLLFSATVYRHRADHPWIVDLHARGVPVSDFDNVENVNQLAHRVWLSVDRYNHHRHGVPRFVGPNVVILREYEPGAPTPGRVSVRRYHWRHPVLRRLHRLRAWLAGAIA